MNSPRTDVLSTRVVRNSLFNAAGFIWTAAILFFQVTYVVYRLGPELYGIWSLAIILSTYFNVFDFGFSATIVKYVSEYRTRGETAAINQVVTNSVLFYLLVDVVAAVLFVFVDDILQFLNVPPHLLPVGTIVAQIAILNFMMTATFVNLFVGVLQGFQRLDVTNRVTILVGVPKVIGTLVAVEFGYGLIGLMVSEFLMVALTVALLAWQTWRIVPQLRIGRRHISWGMFKQLFRFGSFLQVSAISGLVNFHFDKLLLSKFLGLSHLMFYDLGSRVLAKIRGLPLMVAGALLPEFSGLSAVQEEDRIRRVYLKSSKVMLLVILPMFGGIVLTADALVQLWLGGGFELTVLAIRILALAYCINVFTAIASNTARGIGHPELEGKAAAIQIVVHIVASTVLLFSIGFVGTLFGASLALVSGACYYVVRVNRKLNVSNRDFLFSVIAPPVGYLLVSILVGGTIILAVNSLAHLEGTTRELVALLVGGGVFTGCYVLLSARGAYITSEERQLMKTSLAGSFLPQRRSQSVKQG